MSEFIGTLAQLSALVFVICSMFSMGLSLTIGQITAPLKNVKSVVLALLANFVLVPILAVLLTLVFPLDESVEIGLILLAAAAGAPFLPKLAQAAKGDIAFSVGLMVLLMLITIVYLPLVLPLLLGDVAVNPWEIAQSLIFLMLIPLAIGLVLRARYADTAVTIQPPFAQASNFALILLAVLGLVLNFSNMIALVGSWGILAGILFVIAALIVGILLGGSEAGSRSVMGLGTAQRNISAALVVAAQNFDADVLTYLMVIAVIALVILMPVAGELGKRVSATKVDSENSIPA